MGTAFSSITSSTGAKPRDDIMDFDDEIEDVRPTKRRRFNNPDLRGAVAQNRDEPGVRQPLSQLTSSQRARSSKPELVQPSDFYGKSNRASFAPSLPKNPSWASETSKTSVDELFPKSLSKFTKSLRVDVFEINSSVDIENELLNFATVDQPSINISCKVMASIFYAQNEGKQEEKSPIYTELCRLVNPCTLRVSIAKNGKVSRKFVDLNPFYFLPEHFYIKRKCRKPNGQWGGYETTTGFADRYLLTVLVESTEYHEDWPFLDISSNPGVVSQGLENRDFTLDEFHLIGKISPFSNQERQRKIALHLCHVNCHKQKKQSIPYTLNLQVRWAVPNVMTNVVLLDTPKQGSPRTAIPVPRATTPPLNEPTSPVSLRVEYASVENSPANSRAQRHRTDVQTYNLKTLSTLAQGKSPRKRKAREPRLEQNDELSVTYSFGKADAAETGVKQQTTISNLDCPFCNTHNKFLDELRLHLHTDHGALKFHLRRNPPRVQFFIELAKSRSGPMLDIDRSKVFQIGKPRGLFDLDKYLLGDESWVKARHGPLHGLWPDHLQERGHDSSLSSSPHGSRYSSPNTSNGTDDAMDFEMYEAKLPVRPRKTLLVPKTTKPLYDAVTKRVLQPGEEIPTSDDEREEGWLHQKQRDLVNDFTDVTAEEKDYINEWNPFIVEQHMTSDKYLGEAIVRFAEAKKIWFTGRTSRKLEFTKHMETFILRGVIEEKYLHKSLDILRAAEQAKQQLEKEDAVMKDVDVEQPLKKSRGLLMCVCEKFTEPPNRIVCTGPKCSARFFCRDCAKSYGRPIVSAWKCNECVSG